MQLHTLAAGTRSGATTCEAQLLLALSRTWQGRQLGARLPLPGAAAGQGLEQGL